MKKPLIYTISAAFILASIYLIFQIAFPSPNTKSDTTPSQDITTESPTFPTQNIQESTPKTKILTSDTIQPTPIPTPDPQTYACGPGGACNSYQDPSGSDCPITFNDRYCENKCDDPTLRCRI